MIEEIPGQSVPDWISAARVPLPALPIREVLAGSVYYPACRFDGKPIKHLGGNFHSFIYADYGVGQESFIENLDGFRGYRVAASREVTERELVPNGWTPRFAQASNGDSNSHRPLRRIRPFAFWSIHERTEEYGPDHGSDRFSLLYIGGDGVATFQALYHGNGVAPAVVAVIQPGTGFGGNWTDFEDPQDVFARSVLDNPFGVPEYLLFGGWGNEKDYIRTCWPSYGVPVRDLHCHLRLWRQSSEPCDSRPALHDDYISYSSP